MIVLNRYINTFISILYNSSTRTSPFHTFVIFFFISSSGSVYSICETIMVNPVDFHLLQYSNIFLRELFFICRMSVYKTFMWTFMAIVLDFFLDLIELVNDQLSWTLCILLFFFANPLRISSSRIC